MLPFKIKGTDIKIIGSSKSTLYLSSDYDFDVEDIYFSKNTIAKVKLKEFQRNSSWSEYTVTKKLLTKKALDSTRDLFNQIEEIYKNNLE